MERVYRAVRVLARALAVVLIFTPVVLIVLMIWLDLTAHNWPRSLMAAGAFSRRIKFDLS